jgi:glycerophosphoryl diester phosphodiesterase
MSALKRVGHKGADLIVPGNTVASFDAALEVGVDMIEFDVLPARGDDRLILAHDFHDADVRPVLTLQQGLKHLASEDFSGVEFDVDLKLPGYELQVLDALREYGLLERALISSQYRESLAVVRNAARGVRLGWSVPKLRQDPFRNRLMWVPAALVVLVWRELLPMWAASAIRRGECDALMSHWRLVTPRLARAIARAGGELYVWTVDEPERIRSLQQLGATGVITNDPRLFAQAPAGPASH